MECLLGSLREAGATSGFEILAFEQSKAFGHGPVYATGQTDSNWINISERALDLPPRAALCIGTLQIPPFADYLSWAQLDFDATPPDEIDTFPPRSKIGRYLEERFVSLSTPLIEAGVLHVVNETADKISNDEGHWQVITDSGTKHRVDDLLLAVGHQPTALDDQIKAWNEHATSLSNLVLFKDPYPVEEILEAVRASKTVRMAIRGYGLATMDVVRAVALEFGVFEVVDPSLGTLRYKADDDADVVMVPFSLDGLTMGPKPLNSAMDAQFAPSDETLDLLGDHLSDRNSQEEACGANFLTDVMGRIAATVYLDIENRYDGENVRGQSELEALATNWMADQTYSHPVFLDVTIKPEETLDRLAAMGSGEGAVSFDYCIGQVWRHCQPTIYAALSYSALSDEIMAKIISVDESMKRYAYGPPVASLRQLKALHDAGLLNLKFLGDPSISTDTSCWTLTANGRDFKALMMINAVLDSPKIKSVTANILTSLLKDGLIDPVHDDLGISTREDGYIETADGREDVPIAFLGRLAKGTVIGVDAIKECFGQRVKAWSREAVRKAAPRFNE